VSVVLAFLGSPLLGPAVWTPVADDLSRRGWTVIVPPQPDAAPRSGDDVLRSMLRALPADRDLVAIPHSNAGLYVPALTAERSVAGYVFVDAGLPADYGRVPLAPPAFLDLLTTKAGGDGLLPLWTDWWDDADTDALFPDTHVRARVEREQRALPLAYFRESLPVPAGWDTRPGAYLAFGDTYAEDRQEAVRRGWPTATLAGHHLHMLVEPRPVAAEIAILLAAIGFEPGRP